MCRSMVDIQSAAAEIRRGRKEERRTNHSMKIYMVSKLVLRQKANLAGHDINSHWTYYTTNPRKARGPKGWEWKLGSLGEDSEPLPQWRLSSGRPRVVPPRIASPKANSDSHFRGANHPLFSAQSRLQKSSLPVSILAILARLHPPHYHVIFTIPLYSILSPFLFLHVTEHYSMPHIPAVYT